MNTKICISVFPAVLIILPILSLYARKHELKHQQRFDWCRAAERLANQRLCSDHQTASLQHHNPPIAHFLQGLRLSLQLCQTSSHNSVVESY